MTKNMWIVRIPAGRWMAGVNRFNSKGKALDFIDRWNQAEAKSGMTFRHTDLKADYYWSDLSAVKA